jgi:hypothetical protein
MITNSKWPAKYRKKLNIHPVIDPYSYGILKNDVLGRVMEYDEMDNHYSNQHAILDSTLKLLNGHERPIDGGTKYGQKDFELALDRLNLLQKYYIELKMYKKLKRIEMDFV